MGITAFSAAETRLMRRFYPHPSLSSARERVRVRAALSTGMYIPENHS
jgi:hypothetical protein